MSIAIEKIPDFVESVLDKYKRDAYTDLTLKYRHKCAKKYFSEASMNWAAGAKYNFKVRVATENNARVTELYDKDSTNIVSMFDSGEVPWSMYTTNFTYDIREEAFQQGAESGQILIDYIRAKSHGMYEDFWDLLEQHFFESPVSVNQTPRPLLGISHWIQKNGSVATGARNGGNPSGFPAGAAGIDSNTYERWNNWTFAHDGTVTGQGFVERVWEAQVESHFEATHAYPAIVPANTDEKFVMYTTLGMMKQIGRWLRAQNDNLGKDVTAMYGTTQVLNGNVVKEVPYLTKNYSGPGDGNDPFYGINVESLKFARKRGEWMKRRKPVFMDDAHTVQIVHMDSVIASVCEDRAANFVGHRVAA